jgi:hypothetical protein
LLLLSKYLKTRQLVIIALFLFKITDAQNLILNPSFELNDSIDCGSGGFDNYYYFPSPHVVDNWYGYSSPDYYNTLCTNGTLPNQYGFDIPANMFGYSLAKEGNAYAGFISYVRGGSIKEYIYQHLSQPLQAGEIYCLSFFLSKADRVPYAIKSIGAFFSVTTPPITGGYQINAIPQVVNQSGFISDTAQWTQIQGCFTASGGEQYITIGNFTSNANTDTLNVGTNNQVTNGETESYYYIDDISLIDQITVGVNELEKKNSFEVYPNPAKDVLTIKSNSLKENMWIKIYNTIGDVVFKESMSSLNSSFNITGLSNGIYFYEVLVVDKVVKTDKIVIIK